MAVDPRPKDPIGGMPDAASFVLWGEFQAVGHTIRGDRNVLDAIIGLIILRSSYVAIRDKRRARIARHAIDMVKRSIAQARPNRLGHALQKAASKSDHAMEGDPEAF